MDTAGRKTVGIVVVATEHVLEMVAEDPVPRVWRRPEVGVASEILEIAIVVPAAARKGSESTGVGCPGIW